MTTAEEIKYLTTMLHDGAEVESNLRRLVRRADEGPLKERMRQRFDEKAKQLDAIEDKIRELKKGKKYELLKTDRAVKPREPISTGKPVTFFGIGEPA